MFVCDNSVKTTVRAQRQYIIQIEKLSSTGCVHNLHTICSPTVVLLCPFAFILLLSFYIVFTAHTEIPYQVCRHPCWTITLWLKMIGVKRTWPKKM